MMIQQHHLNLIILIQLNGIEQSINYLFLSFFLFYFNYRTSYKDRAKYIVNTGFFPETLEVCLIMYWIFLYLNLFLDSLVISY
jgi:hypothetical protein